LVGGSTGESVRDRHDEGVVGMAMTGTDGRGLTRRERDELLSSGAKFAKIATTNEEGWPTVSPVWCAWDGSSFLVVGKERTGYVRNLRRDPRCGVLACPTRG
jgi:hypothetical protein